MSSQSGSTARTPGTSSERFRAGAATPPGAPAALNIIAAGDSALAKVTMIPSKSVTFYPNDKRQQTYLVISNNSDRKVMFKMKSTRPGVYKMKPVFGMVNPGEKFSIRIAYMGIKIGQRIPLNDRITVVLASVAQKGGEADKKETAEGEMKKRKLDILFKGVNDQKAEQEAAGEAQKKPSAEKPSDQVSKLPVDQQAYMNGYDEGYKAALIESESKYTTGLAKALERLQKTKGIGKEPPFQEGFAEGYKKGSALLKATEKKAVKESAEKPVQKETKPPPKEPMKAPSKEPVKAPSKEPVKAPSKEPPRLPSREIAKAPSKETPSGSREGLIARLKAIFGRFRQSKEIVQVPLKEKAVPLRRVMKPASKERVKAPSKEVAKAPSKEVVKAPSKELAKPVADQLVKTTTKPKVPSKEAVKAPSKEPAKPPPKEPAKPPAKEPEMQPEKVEEEVKKEEQEQEVKTSDGTNVIAATPGGTDPSLGDPLNRKDIVHIGPTGTKQIVIVMYRDPRVPENLLSRSGDEDEDDDNMPSEPPQPPQPQLEPQPEPQPEAEQN